MADYLFQFTVLRSDGSTYVATIDVTNSKSLAQATVDANDAISRNADRYGDGKSITSLSVLQATRPTIGIVDAPAL